MLPKAKVGNPERAFLFTGPILRVNHAKHICTELESGDPWRPKSFKVPLNVNERNGAGEGRREDKEREEPARR